jgi:hypothetical protein
MPEPEVHSLESVDRCIEAFHRKTGNHEEACKAFLAELPTLSGPAGFHAYLACIGKAASLGVIDLLDVGRYCHVAQLAMRAWKLSQSENEKTAHPLPPNGNHVDGRKRSGAPGPGHSGTGDQNPSAKNPAWEPKTPYPLPTIGNHSEEESRRIALEALPDFDSQKFIFKELRRLGVSLPSNSHLQKNPVEALYYCALAKNYVDQMRFADSGPSQQPAQAA